MYNKKTVLSRVVPEKYRIFSGGEVWEYWEYWIQFSKPTLR